MAQIQVRDTASVARKYAQRAGAAGADFTAGVKATTKDWAANTASQEESYNQGVQAAIGRKAFSKGVVAAGSEKWRARTVEIGSTRYPQGVAAAEAPYAQGVGPYLDSLKGFDPGPRGPAGAPQNQSRAAAVADRLHRKKTGQ